MSKALMGIAILIILVVVGVFAFSNVCATAEYRRDTGGIMTADCKLIPRWKLILFELTGVRTGFGYL